MIVSSQHWVVVAWRPSNDRQLNEDLISCQMVAACSSGCEQCTVPYEIGRDDEWPEMLSMALEETLQGHSARLGVRETWLSHSRSVPALLA